MKETIYGVFEDLGEMMYFTATRRYEKVSVPVVDEYDQDAIQEHTFLDNIEVRAIEEDTNLMDYIPATTEEAQLVIGNYRTAQKERELLVQGIFTDIASGEVMLFVASAKGDALEDIKVFKEGNTYMDNVQFASITQIRTVNNWFNTTSIQALKAYNDRITKELEERNKKIFELERRNAEQEQKFDERIRRYRQDLDKVYELLNTPKPNSHLRQKIVAQQNTIYQLQKQLGLIPDA